MRVSEAEKPLLELETRGDAFLDRTLRLPRALSLLAPRADRRALPAGRHAADCRPRSRSGPTGWRTPSLAADAPPWPTVVDQRQSSGARRTPRAEAALRSRCPRRTRPGCGRLSHATRRERSRALARARLARFARAAQRSAAATLLLLLLAIVGAGIAPVQAETAATAVTAGVVGAVVALAAPLPLLIQRALAREGAPRGSSRRPLRQRLAATLRAGCDREPRARAQEAAGGHPCPFARFACARRRRAPACAVAGARRAQARPRHAAHAHRGTALRLAEITPSPAATEAGTLFARFVELIARLRAPSGCPWDREQTHESVKPMTIEEAYEVAHAIDEKDDAELAGELGDLLLQVVFHANIAEERGPSACAR